MIELIALGRLIVYLPRARPQTIHCVSSKNYLKEKNSWDDTKWIVQRLSDLDDIVCMFRPMQKFVGK